MITQFVAYWLNGDGTQDLLHTDVPFSGVSFTRELGVGRLEAELPPEFMRETSLDGRPVIRHWATAIYVFVEGVFFDAYIVAEVTDVGDRVEVECVGWLGYYSGMPFQGNIAKNNIPFKDVVTALVNDPKRIRGGDIGLKPFVGSGFPTLGNPLPEDIPVIPAKPIKPPPFAKTQPKQIPRPVREKTPPKPTPDGKTRGEFNAAVKEWELNNKRVADEYAAAVKTFDAARKHAKNLDDVWRKERDLNDKNLQAYEERKREYDSKVEERKRVFESAQYKINWWSTHDIMRELSNVCDEVGASMRVVHHVDGHNATHSLEVFRESVRTNKSVEFIDGENVAVLPKIVTGSERYATTVRVLGAGEGAKMVHAVSETGAGGVKGLQRVLTVTDKTASTRSRAQSIVNRLAPRHSSFTGVDELRLFPSDYAPLGSFDVGDLVAYKSLDRRGVEASRWLIVNSVEVEPEKEIITVRATQVGV